MKHHFSRREFIRRAAFAAAGAAFSAPFIARNLRAASPSNTILHASIGGSGQAGSDLQLVAHHPFVKLVAIADVDSTKSAPWKERFPEVRIYQDWRELLEKEKQLDTVNVSTPDHMHAPIAMAAMQLGKHVYVQKPLTHDIYETRQLTRLAQQKKLVTQMGIQIHSTSAYRQGVQIVREGVIGKIKEVHSWCGKGWGDPAPLPDRQDTPPANLDWDSWLGVAAARPFIGGGYYHPGNWRKRLDFGTGTFGDMGCHIFDPVFNALELTAPISVRSEGPAPNQWNWANDGRVHYVFPGTAHTAEKTINITWYDGDQRPPAQVASLLGAEPLPGTGSIFVGTKGVMLLPHIARPRLFPDSEFADRPLPKVEDGNHYTQFLEAVRGNGKTTAGFDFSGPLTESVLLGGVASRYPDTTLQWDAKALKFTNHRPANELLRRKYRKGWEVKGLS
jgi:predicted dehydrogenase